MICKLANGKIVKGIIDVYPNKVENLEVKVNYTNVKRILGLDISKDFILPKLAKLGLSYTQDSNDSDIINFEIPKYRHDITSEIDIIEDIARLYNYDNIDSNLNSNINFGTSRVPSNLSLTNFRFKVRDFMISNGYNQIYTQNMIDPKTSALTAGISIELQNPLGEDLSLLRKNTAVSMLKIVSFNIKQGNDNLRLFEIGKSFNLIKDDNGLILVNIS